MPSTTSTSLEQGSLIGKYSVVRELGRGATSAVYLADDPFMKRQVAIKVMFPDVLKDKADGELYRQMFLNEAKLAGKIIHPHIVSIFDAVVEETMSYIVMDYLEQGTLERYCQPESLLPAATVAEIIFKAVRALAFAHMEGLIHRDIKPGNILHRSGTDIKVADFGASINVVTDRTQATSIGSPLYMAPELLTGAKATAQSDIYALGVTMYMLLSGRTPFEATNPASLAYQIVNHEPDKPSTFQPTVPPALDEITARAMAKKVESRYQTWEEFGLDLARVAEVERLANAARVEQATGVAQEPAEVSDMQRFSHLKTLPFFQRFPENELWEVMRISKWRDFGEGTMLIKEGDVGDSFFIIAEGSVKVTRGKRLLNVLGAGDCIGEMSYLAKRDGPRSATVTSGTKCMVMKIRAQDLNEASASCRQLFDRQFLETLIERLETANQQLAVT
jgi:eukaryotic-like serine/threonine-protein kinase